jgi:hypothetical protein
VQPVDLDRFVSARAEGLQEHRDPEVRLH